MGTERSGKLKLVSAKKPMYELLITGSGTSKELAAALRSIAYDLAAGAHIAAVQDDGRCEIEGPTLMTTITDYED